MRYRVGLVAVGVMVMPLLTGCGGGGGGNDSRPARELFPGTWRVSRIQAAGQSTDCAGEITYTENGDQNTVSCGANDTVTFFENGSFTGTSAGGGPYAGTWQFSGNTLTINITTPAEHIGTETERITFSGDNRFTSRSPDDTIATFVRQ